MTNSEKISYLQKLLFNVGQLNVSEYSIRELSTIIRDEEKRESASEFSSKTYLNNLEQTINKQLSVLSKNSDKPKKRIDLCNDCVYNFKQDINRELGNLNQRGA